MKDPGEEFDALWTASVERSEGTLDWKKMTLEEKKVASARFREALERYGQENPMGNRMRGGYASLGSSKRAG